MKNIVFISLISSLLIGIITYFILSTIVDKCSEKYNKEDLKKKSYVGKYVILKKDTLQIIDYSIFNSNYTLSNGVKIDMSSVDLFIIKK